MKKVQMYFDEDVLAELKEYAKAENKSYSEVVRDVVGKFTSRLKKKKKVEKKSWVDDMIAANEDLGIDSRKIDEILYSK